MSVAIVFGPNAPMVDFDGTIRLYETNAAVRRSFDLAAHRTGVSVDVLLRKRDIPEGQSTMRINSVALAAASLGIQDALAAIGITPTAIGGVSLGDMVSPAATGAITRSDVFNMLFTARHEPASSEPGQEEAMAFAYVSPDEDASEYFEPRIEGVWFGASLGKVRWGDGEAITLSGYRSALEEFAKHHPRGNVTIRDQRVCFAAYHTPLRHQAKIELEQVLDGMDVQDPTMPICSSVLDQPVTTADGVRDLLLRNCVESVWVSKMISQIMSCEPRLVVTVGPAKGMFMFPIPVVHIDSPETLADAADAIGPAGSPDAPLARAF